MQSVGTFLCPVFLYSVYAERKRGRDVCGSCARLTPAGDFFFFELERSSLSLDGSFFASSLFYFHGGLLFSVSAPLPLGPGLSLQRMSQLLRYLSSFILLDKLRGTSSLHIFCDCTQLNVPP